MLDLKGNTAVYMLYAHARIAGIIRKGKKDVNEVAQKAQMSLDHPSEVCPASCCVSEPYLGYLPVLGACYWLPWLHNAQNQQILLAY